MPAPKRPVLRAAATGLVAVLLGCAGELALVRRGGEPAFHHRELGYEIADPRSVTGPGWERFEVDGADLAFRIRQLPAARASTMSLQSNCRPTRADVSMLARHLRIGLPSPVLLQGGPIEVDGTAGWSQVFETRSRDVTVRIKTISARVGGCTFDWILVAREAFESLEPSFDDWWRSFQRPPTRGARGTTRRVALR